MPSKSYFLNAQGQIQQDLNRAQIVQAIESGEGLLWIDVPGMEQADDGFLSEVFEFHPLTIQDAMEAGTHLARIEKYEGYIFLVAHGVNYAVESDIVEIAELSVFVGPNYLVTTHEFPLYAIQNVQERLESRTLGTGADSELLAYSVLEAFISNIRPTIDRMAEVADELEDAAINSPVKQALEGILRLKRSSLRINRAIEKQVDVYHQIAAAPGQFVSEEASRYFRDLEERAARIWETNRILHERADNSVALYLSSISIKQNETMKTLAIVAAVFLPLSLVAGIYGMNFENIPELGVSWAYFAVVAGMITVGFITGWWFWLRHRIDTRRISRAAGGVMFRVPAENLARVGRIRRGSGRQVPPSAESPVE